MLTERAARPDDVEAILALYVAFDVAVRGFVDSDAGDITDEWGTPGFDMTTGSRVVERDGRVVGYGVVLPNGSADSVVDVAETSTEVQELLLAWLESRDGEVRHFLPAGYEPVSSLFAQRGWERDRVFWRMRIDLDRPTPSPAWPDGVVVRGMDREADARAVHSLIATAFLDIDDGHPLRPYDEWRGYLLGDRFDPELYLVAVEGEEIVGACLGQDMKDYAYVRQLGVPRRHRGRGIGLALLREVFQRAAARGFPQCQLGVDAANPSGALRLYEVAGMRVSEEFHSWARR